MGRVNLHSTFVPNHFFKEKKIEHMHVLVRLLDMLMFNICRITFVANNSWLKCVAILSKYI